ncbi:hypothetical protein [Iamia sp.]|uniref:hypothetical protein n=1 Tax=Iamia sp. TaxID=2722710 RepID=UPI002CAD3DF9|nr:hypothetical protein [Iamia sp.]HXH58457.1 hypothetical protein [Iamia sp.]
MIDRLPRAPMRSCPTPGCGALTTGGKCTTHASQHEQARGRRQQRGYDNTHDRLRKAWASRVANGTIRCARCQQPIGGDQPWALDHTDDRSGYLGPSHKACNDSAGGRAAHQ